MPCIAWSKKWEVNIFNAIWNVGFASQHAKSQPSKCSPHGFLCRHCSLSVKAYELPPRPALRASQVDWLVCLEQRSCSSGWSCSVLLYLLTFTVTANTHNAPVRLKHIAPQSVADFSKQLHGQTVTMITPSSHYIKQTKKQTKKPYRKSPNNSQIGYHYQESIHHSQTLWHILNMAPEKTTQYLFIWIPFYSLSLLCLSRDSLRCYKT